MSSSKTKVSNYKSLSRSLNPRDQGHIYGKEGGGGEVTGITSWPPW